MLEKIVPVTTIIVLLSSISLTGNLLSLASSQPETRPLPAILIHGYNQNKSVWNTWEGLLESARIPYYSVTFNQSSDKCGAAIDHATELDTLIQKIINSTNYQKVNLVGYSKGGLDARVYLDASNTNAVENLIMISTPNDGSVLADRYYQTDRCTPAVYDLMTNSTAIEAAINPNTEYYTISSHIFPNFFDGGGNPEIPGADDGWVAVESVESEDYNNLGPTLRYHLTPPDEIEFDLVRDVLAGEE
ncbi:MAG TPA: alpha/beta hydrolase [Nitrososphaeraceae archaeon]|nr:alpha/beta hydrolase [Nitrososphaeraceae archaeon]